MEETLRLTIFPYKDRENQVSIGLACHRDGFNLSLSQDHSVYRYSGYNAVAQKSTNLYLTEGETSETYIILT